jgi:pyruvate dehydrogenase E2 component (dihydrolipoamide acetyltransferase)
MSAGAAIIMPKLGLTMTEGLLASWRVQPGDEVNAGDVLFVVETEKIATEVEAQGSGRIETIEITEGSTAPVGAVVATWSGAETASNGEASTPSDPARSNSPEPGARIIATPLARKLARNAGIELSALNGSGPRGRIKARDVEAAVASSSGAASSTRPETTPARRQDEAERASVAKRPATAIEKVVARRLTLAKQTIPHFYVQAEADVTRLLALREELNTAGDAPRISLTHFVVAALARALAKSPEMNVLWADDNIVQLDGADIGIAVDTDRGLLVPVLRNAHALALDTVASASATLFARAREGRLDAADLEGGAISVSNVGMFGASYLTPIINPGQSAILGVAAIRPAFRPDAAGQPILRQEMGLVLSCDHRVLDGVKAARFLDRVTTLLQQPLSLLRA